MSTNEIGMHFDETDTGDFKIYTGAVEAPQRGYRASLVIKRVRGVAAPREVYREEDMAGGHIWPTPNEALSYAMTAAKRLVRDNNLLLRGA